MFCCSVPPGPQFTLASVSRPWGPTGSLLNLQVAPADVPGTPAPGSVNPRMTTPDVTGLVPWAAAMPPASTIGAVRAARRMVRFIKCSRSTTQLTLTGGADKTRNRRRGPACYALWVHLLLEPSTQVTSYTLIGKIT